MATVTVNINAVDNMSAVIASLQQQLNTLQQQATINLGGRMGKAANQMVGYTTRLYENMLNSLGTKLWKTFTNNLKSAYQEIKAIDDELVVVRRVTGKTNEELAGMTKNAMKVAQTYGLSASKYLSGVADFTRAGYQGQAEGLAELSVKLQRAGDVSADVANQYLLAIDKAYGLQGNITALTAAMDGANQIGNEYATNVGEIAAGIGKLATIASTAHVSIGELTAALGTVTAVTQRSGTEAATALRAIFLNIMGDTTTEIEDGAKWTAGEIEGLRQVLELYAPEVVRAAEATGTLIDPMEAIGALAKSYKAGILTEAKLFSMVSDIGGKLRTNQLMVLIKKWDMYESMLKTYEGASGSIDREVQNSLDSITVKTERLKASWTALVNNTVSSTMIKGILDLLNGTVQSVENLSNALSIVLGLVLALKAQRLATLLGGAFNRTPEWVTGATGTIRGLGLMITTAGVVISTLNAAVNNYNRKVKEQQDSAAESGKKASQSSNEILKLYSTYVTATAGTEEYTTALIALAEALGMTQDEALKAEGSIKSLTLKQLQEAESTAKAALDTWNRTQTDSQYSIQGFLSRGWETAKSVATGEGKPTYGFSPKDMSKEMWEIVEEAKDLNNAFSAYYKYYFNRGNFVMVPSITKAELFVPEYETFKELKKRLDEYAREANIDISGFSGYKEINRYLEENEERYKSAKQALESYISTARDAKIGAMPMHDAMEQTLADIKAGKEVDKKVLEDYAAAWDEMIESITDDAYDGKGKLVRNSLIKYLGETYPLIAKYSKEWREFSHSGDSGFQDSISDATNSVNNLTKALSTATKAKNEFDAAMERDAENKGFADYQSAYSTYAEEIEAGRVNSQKAMAAARYLMAGSGYDFDTIYREEGFKGINAFMKNGPYKKMYGDAEKTYAEGFLDVLGSLADKQTGEIKLGEKVVATYKKVGQQVEFTVSDLEGLGRVTKLGTDQTWQAIKALSVYGTLDTDIDKFTDSLEKLGEEAGFLTEAGENGELGIDYQKLLAYAKESGMTSDQWKSMKDWLNILNEAGEISLSKVPDYEEGWQNYDDMVDGVADKAEKAAESAEEAKDSLEEASETVTQTTAPGLPEPVEGSVIQNPGKALYDEYASVLGELDALIASKDYTIVFDANGDPAMQTIQAINNDANVASRERTITFDPQTGGVVQIIDVLKDHADNAAETRTIHFEADGSIKDIDIVKRNAENPELTNQYILYYTDGKVENIQQVEETAKGAFQEHLFQVNFGTNGEIVGLTETEKTAEGVKTKVHEFTFGANGQVMYDKVREYTTYADGTTSDPIEYTLTAEDGQAYDNIASILTYLEDNYDGHTGEYYLEGDPSGVNDGVKTAEEVIGKSIDGTDTTYHLSASFDEMEPLDLSTLPLDENGIPTYHVPGIVQLDPIVAYDTGNVEDDIVTYDENGNPTIRPGGVFQIEPIAPLTDDVDEGGGLISNLIGYMSGLLSGDIERANGAIYRGEDGRLYQHVNSSVWSNGSQWNGELPDGIYRGEDGKLYQRERGVTVDAELEVTADEASAADAAAEAADIAKVTLKENPPPLPYAITKDDQYEYAGETDEVTYGKYSVELEDGGTLEEILAVSKLDGSKVIVTIQTNGDGQQTITQSVEDVNGLVSEVHTVTIDADGNAVTDLETIEDLQTFIDRTVKFSVDANISDSQSKLNRLKTTLEGIKNKTITVTTNTKSPLAGLAGLLNLPKAANGASNFKGGNALINEEGPELVVGNGLASIYANGFPTIAKIPKGATIYTAKETASLLGGTMSIPAYADGTNGGGNLMDLLGGVLGFFGYSPAGDSKEKLTVPPPKKDNEEDKKKSEREEWEQSQGSQTKSSEDGEEADFWDIIRKYIDYGLKKIQYQIDSYQDDITAIERARDELLKPIEEELEDLDYSLSMLQYEVTLLERARDDAIKPLNKEIERLEKERDINKENIDLEEKRQALEDARHQRTIRYFNEETGQWEWMADAKAIKEAEEAYADALADFEITTLKRERDAIEDQYKEQIEALEDQEEVIERKQEDLEHERTKIEYEYGESIDPLQDALDKLQQTYDDLDKYYQRLVDAVEVPLESLTDALQKMMGAGENYVAQMEGTVKLLDALYALAPTWDAITVGDIGKYSPEQGKYGSYSTVDQSTTIIVDGITIDGSDAKTMTDILGRHRLYRNR